MSLLDDADALVAEGDYSAALERSAAAYAGAGSDLEVACAARAVAVAHQCLDQLGAAARHAGIAIEAFERAGDEVHPQLAEALHVAAVARLSEGDLEAAIPLLERAAGVLEQAGARHDLASVLLTLGEVSTAMGAADQARALYERVLMDVSDSEPESETHARHLDALTAKAFLGLGSAAALAEHRAEAEDMLARAVEFFDAAFGYAHPEMVAALEEIAALHRLVGNEPAAAAALEERAVAVRMLAEVEAVSPSRAATEAAAAEGGAS